ncbi:hypothetical protein [Actimicrobium antarcticum]|uniref:ABC transmembrane type-1 domain-containing protein n=1 Tax=Actimicrobium antarcticum TaxID=1051899 RepID=A0ABP7T399_9BURK
MSILAIAFPAQAAVPVAQSAILAVVAAARPLFGIGVFVTLFLVFRPLLAGVLRAALLVLKPRKSLEQRSVRSRLRGILTLNRMASDLDHCQPNVASELRAFAARG